MTTDDFRDLALSLPGAEEMSHMNHPDFRVGGKIFATLSPAEDRGMVKLTPDQQEQFLNDEPQEFEPASGAWGRGGATMVKLRGARTESVERALIAAWRNTAPKDLVRIFDES